MSRNKAIQGSNHPIVYTNEMKETVHSPKFNALLNFGYILSINIGEFVGNVLLVFKSSYEISDILGNTNGANFEKY